MKKLHKIFAIAAIAAASMFSAQPASAAVTSVDATTSASSLDLTFGYYWGDAWMLADIMIENNPHKNEIVVVGMAYHIALQKGTITESDKEYYVNQLLEYDCPVYVIMQIQCVTLGY